MHKNNTKNNQKQSDAVQIVGAGLDAKTSQRLPPKTTRAKFVCNPALAKLIRQANVLPVDFQLGEDIYTSFQELPEEVRTFLEDYTNEYEIPSDAFQLEGYKYDRTHIAILNLEIIYKSRELIKNLVRFVENAEVKGSMNYYNLEDKATLSYDAINGIPTLFAVEELLPTNPLHKILESLSAIDIELDKNGIIDFHLPAFAQTLRRVDVSRLRACEICGKFFGLYARTLLHVQSNTQQHDECA